MKQEQSTINKIAKKEGQLTPAMICAAWGLILLFVATYIYKVDPYLNRPTAEQAIVQPMR